MTSEMYSRQLFFNPLKNINGFVFVSHFSEKKHIEHNEGFNNAIEMVIYNYTKPLLKPCKKEKKDYFLYYGRLSFEKGIPTLLKVFAKHPELQLKVVGTGPLEKMLKKKYKIGSAGASLGTECNENIQFLGYHSGVTLFELVRNAKFVCVPSEWYENNPMTIIEAYSLGTPVIGANIGGIPEIVQEDNTGWLFETGNEESLEQTIVKASKIDDEKYADMCENAYSFYEDNFSEDVHYKKLIQLYNLIINNKK